VDNPFYIMGTGSRSMVNHPHAKQIYEGLRDFLVEAYARNSNIILISGLAEGWDEAVAKVGMRECIPYIAAIPNSGYGEYYWARKSQTGHNRISVFNELVASAQEVVYVCDTLYVNGVHSNFIRNSWMVDRANEAVVYMAHSSGTRDAVAKLSALKIPYTTFDSTGQFQRVLF